MASIALLSASSGLNALNTQLDVSANNLANVNTPGFKASRANFQDLLYIERAQPGVENANQDQRPIGLHVGLGVKVSGTQQDFNQGAPMFTGRELDVAIEGDGFFVVGIEDDAGGTAYTRAGNLSLNSDGELVMANDQGRRLQPIITIPEDAIEVDVSPDGRVFVLQPGDNQPQEVGQIELATFVNPPGLKSVGENLWVETPASGAPVEGEPGTGGRGSLLQNFLEASNVDPTRELVELIRTQRAFEMNSQSIRAADDTLQQVAQLRR